MNCPFKVMADPVGAAENKRIHIQRWIGQLPSVDSIVSTPSSSSSSMCKGHIAVTIPGNSLSIARGSRRRSFLAKVQALCLKSSRVREDERFDGDTGSAWRKFDAKAYKIEGNRAIRKIKVGESWEGVHKDQGNFGTEKWKLRDEGWREIKIGGVGIGIGRGSLGPRPQSRISFQMEPNRSRVESTYIHAGLGAPKSDYRTLAEINGVERSNRPEGNTHSYTRERTSIPVSADARRLKHGITPSIKEQEEHCYFSAIQASGRYHAGDIFEDIDREIYCPNSRAGRPSPVYHNQEPEYYYEYDYDELYDELDSSEDEDNDGLAARGNESVNRRARFDRAAKMLGRESMKTTGGGRSMENMKWVHKVNNLIDILNGVEISRS